MKFLEKFLDASLQKFHDFGGIQEASEDFLRVSKTLHRRLLLRNVSGALHGSDDVLRGLLRRFRGFRRVLGTLQGVQRDFREFRIIFSLNQKHYRGLQKRFREFRRVFSGALPPETLSNPQ